MKIHKPANSLLRLAALPAAIAAGLLSVAQAQNISIPIPADSTTGTARAVVGMVIPPNPPLDPNPPITAGPNAVGGGYNWTPLLDQQAYQIIEYLCRAKGTSGNYDKAFYLPNTSASGNYASSPYPSYWHGNSNMGGWTQQNYSRPTVAEMAGSGGASTAVGRINAAYDCQAARRVFEFTGRAGTILTLNTAGGTTNPRIIPFFIDYPITSTGAIARQATIRYCPDGLSTEYGYGCGPSSSGPGSWAILGYVFPVYSRYNSTVTLGTTINSSLTNGGGVGSFTPFNYGAHFAIDVPKVSPAPTADAADSWQAFYFNHTMPNQSTNSSGSKYIQYDVLFQPYSVDASGNVSGEPFKPLVLADVVTGNSYSGATYRSFAMPGATSTSVAYGSGQANAAGQYYLGSMLNTGGPGAKADGMGP